jgi:hypothetical protein
MSETQTQALLRNARQALDVYRDQENEARKELARAVELTRRAKEKHGALFAKEEAETVARMKAGYYHCTA